MSRFALGLVLIASSSGIFATVKSTNFSPASPQPTEWLAHAIVEGTDPKTRGIKLKIESLVKPDGTEIGFGKPPIKNVTLWPGTRITRRNQPNEWLKAKSLEKGQQVFAYISPTRNADWTAHKVTVNTDAKLPDMVSPPPVTEVAPDRICLDPVTVPMVFPVTGKVRWSDTFLAPRGGGTRRHQGQDLMGDRLVPLVACFTGRISMRTGGKNAGYSVTLVGENGWTAQYYHVNNDSPSTDDGIGGERYAFAPGLVDGDRVLAGTFLGYLGDSGNAEETAPHLHFELWHTASRVCYNATPSLRAATKLTTPTYSMPMPEFEPSGKLTRVDGVILSANPESSLFTLNLISAFDAKEIPKVIVRPSEQMIGIPSTAQIIGTYPWDVVTVANLQPGTRIAAMVTPGENRAVSVAVLGTVPVKPPVAPPTDEPALEPDLIDPGYQSPTNNQFLTEFNTMRAKFTEPALVLDDNLSKVAQRHASLMIDRDFYSIIGPGGWDPFEEAKRAGFSTKNMFVLLGKEPKTEDAIKAMLKDHADKIKAKGLTKMGIGSAFIDEDPGRIRHKNYWTVILTGNTD